MALKLTKQELAQREELTNKLSYMSEALSDALMMFNTDRADAFLELASHIEAYNKKVTDAFDDVAQAVSSYNEALEEAQQFVADVASRIDSEISERSERWQESEKGQAASKWLSDWQDADFDTLDVEAPEELEVDEPDEFEVDDYDHLDRLNELAEQPED